MLRWYAYNNLLIVNTRKVLSKKKRAKDKSMAWYTIPEIKIKRLHDTEGKVKGVVLKIKDFQKLENLMEDFLDYEAVERVRKESGRLYLTSCYYRSPLFLIDSGDFTPHYFKLVIS